MQLLFEGISGRQLRGVGEILEERGHSLAEGEEAADLIITATADAKRGYAVKRTGQRARIAYCREIDLFRALGIVLTRASCPAYFEESPGNVFTSGNAGVMFDCSRNSVLTVETIKSYIRKMALMGLNELLLYTEDTYAVEGYPYFGALRGRYTRDEIQECCSYAGIFGIELIPCIQTLAHLRTALRWPAMQKYRDDEDILLAEEEATYALIDAMLRSVRDMYTSTRIHLGMDEAFFLGCGNYRKKHGLQQQAKIMNRHIARVLALCKKYGFEPMIWSDMYFVTQGKGDYLAVPPEHEWPAEDRPGRDLTLVYWDYYSHDSAVYERMIRLHNKLTDKVYWAAGGWTWNGLSPNYAKAADTIKCGMAALDRVSVWGGFLTLWQDNGAETPAVAGLPVMCCYSRAVYREDTDPDSMEAWFRMLTGESYRDMLALDRLDHIPGTKPHNAAAANPTKQILYQDPLAGIFDREYAGKGLAEYYCQTADRLRAAAERSRSFGRLYRYYALLAQIVSVKSELGVKIRDAYLCGDKNGLSDCRDTLLELRRQAAALGDLREELWDQEAKPAGFEVIDIRIGGLVRRLDTAARRLERYLSGALDRLDELNEERLFYSAADGGPFLRCNLWENIVSAANMVL